LAIDMAPSAPPRLQVRVDALSAINIHLVNLFFALMTCGVYYFWGKSRSQAFFIGQIEFEGDRFAFFGEGLEFFKGWCKAAGFFAAYILIQLLIDFNDASAWQLWSTVFVYVVIILVSPLASVGIRRFRYSRTAWRGIYFSFRGSTKAYAKIFIPNALLAIMTLGVLYPRFAVRTLSYLTNHTYFGDEPFHYEGNGSDFQQDCVASLVKSGLTLGFSWTWFHARKTNYDWSRTTFRGLRFESTQTGGGLTKLWAINLILLLLTCGLAWPWLRLRNAAYAAAHLKVIGEVDWEKIGSSRANAGAAGEQLGELLGGSFFDAGWN
jgi:uncharacterized membrane protein YjgN (DUF898 family)